MKERAEEDEKGKLLKQLNELTMIVKRCGEENRWNDEKAATFIQSFFRGRMT